MVASRIARCPLYEQPERTLALLMPMTGRYILVGKGTTVLRRLAFYSHKTVF